MLLHSSIIVVNGFTSMVRNMLLISSIGFAAMGFSNSFKEHKYNIRILAYLFFIYSIVYGFLAAKNFNEYLNSIKNRDKLSDEDKLLINHWKTYDDLAYIYCGMLIIFVIILLKYDIQNNFK